MLEIEVLAIDADNQDLSFKQIESALVRKFGNQVLKNVQSYEATPLKRQEGMGVAVVSFYHLVEIEPSAHSGQPERVLCLKKAFGGSLGKSPLEHGIREESDSLGMLSKAGGKYHLRLNIGERPIANKYQ
ncbi:hypothetical protein BC829DRAFT_423335 [Chytridium lagenaria]|nr:hypothetical protein BC829DRAFT_423335 [Chytridium lagenaria]